MASSSKAPAPVSSTMPGSRSGRTPHYHDDAAANQPPIAFPSVPVKHGNSSSSSSPSSPTTTSTLWRSRSKSRKNSGPPSSPTMLQGPIHLIDDRWNSPRRAPRPPAEMSEAGRSLMYSLPAIDLGAPSQNGHLKRLGTSSTAAGDDEPPLRVASPLNLPTIQPRDESIGCLGHSNKSKGKSRAVDSTPRSPIQRATSPPTSPRMCNSSRRVASPTVVGASPPSPTRRNDRNVGVSTSSPSPPKIRKRPLLPMAYHHQTPQALPGSPTFAALIARDRQLASPSPLSPRVMSPFGTESTSAAVTSAASSRPLSPGNETPLDKPELPRPLIPANQQEMGVIMAAGNHQRRRNRSAGDILDLAQVGLTRRPSNQSTSTTLSRGSPVNRPNGQRIRLNSLPLNTLEGALPLSAPASATATMAPDGSSTPAQPLSTSHSADNFPRAMHRFPSQRDLSSSSQRQLRSSSSKSSLQQLRMAMPTGWAKGFLRKTPASPSTAGAANTNSEETQQMSATPSPNRAESASNRYRPGGGSPFSVWRRQPNAATVNDDDDESSLFGGPSHEDAYDGTRSPNPMLSGSQPHQAKARQRLPSIEGPEENSLSVNRVRSKRSLKSLRDKVAKAASPNKVLPPPSSPPQYHYRPAAKSQPTPPLPKAHVPARIATDYGKLPKYELAYNKPLPSPQGPSFLTDLQGMVDSSGDSSYRSSAHKPKQLSSSSDGRSAGTNAKNDLVQQPLPNVAVEEDLRAPDRPWQIDTVINRGSPLFAHEEEGGVAGDALRAAGEKELGPFAATLPASAHQHRPDEIATGSEECMQEGGAPLEKREEDLQRQPHATTDAEPSAHPEMPSRDRHDSQPHPYSSASRHASHRTRVSGTASACSEDVEAMAHMDLGELLEGYRRKRDSVNSVSGSHEPGSDQRVPHPYTYVAAAWREKIRADEEARNQENDDHEDVAALQRGIGTMQASTIPTTTKPASRPASGSKADPAAMRPMSKPVSMASSYGTSFDGDVIWDGASTAMSTLAELTAADEEEEEGRQQAAREVQIGDADRTQLPEQQAADAAPAFAKIDGSMSAKETATAHAEVQPLPRRRAGGHAFRFPRPPGQTNDGSLSAPVTSAQSDTSSALASSTDRPSDGGEAANGSSQGHHGHASTPSLSSSVSASTASHATTSTTSGSAGHPTSALAMTSMTAPVTASPSLPSAAAPMQYGSAPSWISPVSPNDDKSGARSFVSPTVTPPLPSSAIFSSYHHQPPIRSARSRTESGKSHKSTSSLGSSSVASSAATGATEYSARFVQALSNARHHDQHQMKPLTPVDSEPVDAEQVNVRRDGKEEKGETGTSTDKSPEGTQAQAQAVPSSSSMPGHRRLKSSIDLLEKAGMATIGEH
ncbi:hypothetical protein BDZ90DRAFT_28688 [Jaminaea rosea]|uniref:Uncharacterized protein n=1 Tax=Jaminaea rosea TaxID=1569628 RepID=A0A316V065_9BASI|nr:hypothetical protein BDZ90DRAFT_28688 [Jaminaea rosea]PWN30939.1 hypothetical protein BDZ90DRAFT_28688 [Jaminaea rosea]